MLCRDLNLLEGEKIKRMEREPRQGHGLFLIPTGDP